jgi:hypothetical protein
MNVLASVVISGVVATAATDFWAIARRRLLGLALPDYGLVGRWLAYMPRGRFQHNPIAKTEAVTGERLLGWSAHYLIGIGYAALPIAIWGLAWMQQPTLLPALTVGVVTVAAPFLLMQPGMGAGIAASRTPRPGPARLQSLIMHAVFGVGLYAGAVLSTLVQGQ